MVALIARKKEQPGQTLAVRVRSEPRCKLCTSVHRHEVERLLVKQYRREKDDKGEVITFPYIISYCAEKLGMYVTMDNIKAHKENHFQLKDAVNKALAEADKKSTSLLQTTVLSEIFDKLDARTVQREIIARGLQQIREVDGASITPDHVLKALEMEAKQQVSNPLDALMEAAANAMNFTTEVARGKLAAPETEVVFDLEDGEIEDEVCGSTE